MKCVINFDRHVLIRDNVTTPLLQSSSGHIFADLQPINSGLWIKDALLMSPKAIFALRGFDRIDPNRMITIPKCWTKDDQVDISRKVFAAHTTDDQEPNRAIPTLSNEELSAVQIRKLHVHLWHVSAESMIRLLNNAQRAIDIKTIHSALEPCKCEKTSTGMQRPLVHINGATQCGYHIALDIFYPVPLTSQKFPFLAIIFMLSRFAVVALLVSHRTPAIVDALSGPWFQIFGRPREILTDHSPMYAGAEREEMMDTFEIQHTVTSSHFSHENGMIERSIGLIKVGFDKIRPCLPKLGVVRAMT